MDTTWWAVDKRGHIAHFSTGEAGCVPENINQDATSQEDLIRLLNESPPAGTTFFADDLFDQADGKLYLRSWQGKWNESPQATVYAPSQHDFFWGYLLWLRDEEALKEVAPPTPGVSLTRRIFQFFSKGEQTAPPSWLVLRLPVPGKVVIWLAGPGAGDPPPIAFVQDLLRRGIALRGYAYSRALEVERMGIFSYELDRFDNWICGPYQRSEAPPRPLKLDQLPEEIRSALEVSRMPVIDFLRDELLQPFEHGNAYCWGEDWVSTTGEHRRTTGPKPSDAAALPPVLEAPYESNLVRLLASYISVVPGSAEVLGDYLEDAGQDRIAAPADAAERLEEVLLRFFSSRERWQLETEFVEQLIESRVEETETRDALRSTLDTVRKYHRGEIDAEALGAVAAKAFQAWQPNVEDLADEEGPVELRETPAHARLAWATWGLAARMPLVAARTCRAIDETALQRQAEMVLQRLDQRQRG